MAEGPTHKMIIYAMVMLFLLKGVHNAAPQFDYFPTPINVTETATYGDVIWNCNATDGDNSSTSAGQLRYEVRNQGYRPEFFLDSRNCQMYVFAELDYEDQQIYSINITVLDPTSLQTTVETLTIHITDVNDNAPHCEEYYPVLSVPENQPVNVEIARPSCIDLDLDKSTNGKVLYKVADSNSVEVKDTFEVNNDNGSVTVKKLLDYERVKSYVLTIDVYDNAGAESLTTIITYNIQVKDIDDNTPTWPTNPLTVSVNEWTSLGTVAITLTANDADKPMTAASTITYGIQTPTVPDLFGIESVTGVVYVNGFLDCGIPSRLRMEVYAYSSNNIADKSILVIDIIIIGDTTLQQIGNSRSCVNSQNNFSPVFDYFPTSVNVPETATFGDEIWRCNATDRDYQSNVAGRIRFQFSEQNTAWSLDSRDCVMYVNTRLDYEARTTYTLRVVANDLHPVTSRSTTGTVTIHITNVNDNAPECAENSSVLFIQEDKPINIELARAVCTDVDSYGRLFFKVSDSNSVEVKKTFEVNNDNGIVTLKKQLDYERVKSYVLTIDVYDNAGAESLTTIITYNIQVKDIDDNKPTWGLRYTTIDLYRELSTLGTVAFTRTARDADKPLTAASTITYGIQTPAVPDWFGIDSVTGTVYVKEVFQNSISRLRMEVYAYSSNKSTDISVLIVNIRIYEIVTTPFQFIPTETSTVSVSTTTDFTTRVPGTRKLKFDTSELMKGLGTGIGLTLVGIIIIILIVVFIYKYRNRTRSERKPEGNAATDIGVAQEETQYEELFVLHDVNLNNDRRTNNS